MKQIIDTIGNTPLVEVSHPFDKPNVKIYAKLEGNNPAGSVKDRPALNMIRSALERNEIKVGGHLIEATSGNTGIALAMIAAISKVHIELVMPASSTKERIATMEAYGAKVTLLETMEDCRDYAEEKAKRENIFILNQFSNPDNYEAHIKTTGPEIWNDTNGTITHFVSSMGTTGTIMGCSIYLKSKNPNIQIVGCQPTEGSSIPGIRRWSKEYLPKIFDPSRVDRVIDIAQEHAIRRTRELARQEGIFVGMSSGGGYHAALQVASEIEEGIIVFIACDRGDRYLSSDLFT